MNNITKNMVLHIILSSNPEALKEHLTWTQMEKLKPTSQDGPYVSPSVLPLLICRDVLSDGLHCEVQQNNAAFTPGAPDCTRSLPLERQSVKVSENIGGSCLFKVFLFFCLFRDH